MADTAKLFAELFKIAAASSEAKFAKIAVLSTLQKALLYGGLGLGGLGAGYGLSRWAVGKGREAAEQRAQEEANVAAAEQALQELAANENVPETGEAPYGFGYDYSGLYPEY